MSEAKNENEQQVDFTVPLPRLVAADVVLSLAEVIRPLDYQLFEDLRRAGLAAQVRHWKERQPIE